jgi:ribosomal protein L29
MEASAESIQKRLKEGKAEVSRLEKQSREWRRQAQESSGQMKLDLEKTASEIDARIIDLRVELARWRFKLEKALQRRGAYN